MKYETQEWQRLETVTLKARTHIQKRSLTLHELVFPGGEEVGVSRADGEAADGVDVPSERQPQPSLRAGAALRQVPDLHAGI